MKCCQTNGQGYVECPSRSPDLTSLDFTLWEFLKANVYATNPATIIEQERSQIPIEMLLAACDSIALLCEHCRDHSGHQFENMRL